jgi:hypothetical protein
MAAAVAVVLCACALASLRRTRGLRLSVAIGAVIGLSIGSALPWSQRGADARTQETVLAAAVYSHLNYFCAMEISGHRRLFLVFSAIPAQRIEVTYSEYPVGRPSRFAYLDAAHELHVVEAESGEKGPFNELARGPLPAGATLGITLFDEQQPIAEIELADFASQASTQLSPTAGWGRAGKCDRVLAEQQPSRRDGPSVHHACCTSVGRGFDSVGHRPGLYRNRIDVRRITAP